MSHPNTRQKILLVFLLKSKLTYSMVILNLSKEQILMPKLEIVLTRNWCKKIPSIII